MKTILKIFIPFFALLLFSCSEDVVEFKGADTKVAKVSKGKPFKIQLYENHAEGQSWSIVPKFDAKVVEYIKSSYHGPEEGLTDFLFEAKEKGETTLYFTLIEYAHPKDSVAITVQVE